MRILHLLVIGALLFAAGYVYKIKMETTVRTERVIKLRQDIRNEREAIAGLRAEWARLQTPARIQELASRHLKLAPLDAKQYDALSSLPVMPPRIVQPGQADPIGAMIDTVDPDISTGTIVQQGGDQ